MSLLSVALGSARTYLNDDAAQVWSDAALIPKLQEAHRELQIKLWEVNSPVVRKQSVEFLISAGATTLTTPPADMLTPFKLVEYASIGETLVNAVDMTEQNFLPTGTPISNKLVWWSWKEELITFLGATVDRKVVVYYRKSIPVPASAGDPIGILFGELYLGARAGAIAHGSVGNKDAYGIMTALAADNFSKVVAAQRGQQTPPYKP
jgi:hypothetical protein